MCKHGTEQIVKVKISAELSHTGESYMKNVAIDACIAPLVKALQEGGIDMLDSCCGHGTRCGEIDLADGRTLLIAPPRSEEANVEFEEVAQQAYQDMVIAAGLVTGHPCDTIYFSIERPGKPECSFRLLLRTDEALVLVWAIGQALWSQEMVNVEAQAPLPGVDGGEVVR